MSSLSPEALGPGFIGQVLDDDGATVGTCWLVAPGWPPGPMLSPHPSPPSGHSPLPRTGPTSGR